MKELITSPYRRGADDGFIFGLYLTLMFFGSIFAAHIPMLGLLSLVMAAAVPVVIYIFMRRYDRQMNGCATFPMFWMQGVVTFICGTLIAGALLVVYLHWIDPGFVLRQLQTLVETGSAPELKGTSMAEAATMASQMIEARFVPTGVQIVTEIVMVSIVSGSLLSILLGSFFALRHRIGRRNYGPQR